MSQKSSAFGADTRKPSGYPQNPTLLGKPPAYPGVEGDVDGLYKDQETYLRNLNRLKNHAEERLYKYAEELVEGVIALVDSLPISEEAKYAFKLWLYDSYQCKNWTPRNYTEIIENLENFINKLPILQSNIDLNQYIVELKAKLLNFYNSFIQDMIQTIEDYKMPEKYKLRLRVWLINEAYNQENIFGERIF